MKTKLDPRHLKRKRLVQQLFAWDFQPKEINSPSLKEIIFHLKPVDAVIEKAAPAWPLAKIARIDLAILRLAVYELCFAKKTPVKVVIDEAVELAKEFGADQSPAFINGVLGTIYESR